MPVFERKGRVKTEGSLIQDALDMIEGVKRQLRVFHGFDVEWITDYLEDKETDLLLDPSVEEYEQIRDNLELIQEKLEEIEEDYDLEDEAEDVQDELEDLECELE